MRQVGGTLGLAVTPTVSIVPFGVSQIKAAYTLGVDHPLVRRNPDTHRLALFMAGYWEVTLNLQTGSARDDVVFPICISG